jgi:hypothetical protein
MNLELPKLDGLEPSSEDYVSKLEDGIRTSLGVLDNIDSMLDANIEFVEEQSLTQLTEIDEVEWVINEDVPGKKIRCYSLDAKRAVEDLILDRKMHYEERSKPLFDLETKARRRIEDFGLALQDLTTLRPLQGYNLEVPVFRIYAVHEGTVYEGIGTHEVTNVPMAVIKNPAMNPDIFENVTKARHWSFNKKFLGNLFYVSNPSELIKPALLFDYAIKEVAKLYAPTKKEK